MGLHYLPGLLKGLYVLLVLFVAEPFEYRKDTFPFLGWLNIYYYYNPKMLKYWDTLHHYFSIFSQMENGGF